MRNHTLSRANALHGKTSKASRMGETLTNQCCLLKAERLRTASVSRPCGEDASIYELGHDPRRGWGWRSLPRHRDDRHTDC